MVILVALLLLVSVSGFAQEARTGTNAASELLIPVGARYIGMGGAPLAVVSGIDAIYYNPAGLASSDKSAYGMFSQMSYIADIDVTYAAASVNFEGFGSLAFAVKSLNVGEIDITTVDLPDGTGATFSPQFLTVGLTYSRALSDRVYVGVTGNLVSETMDRVKASGMVFDFGVQYRGVGQIDGLSLGLAVKNIGQSMQFEGTGLVRQTNIPDGDRPTSPTGVVAQTDELPTSFEIGLNYSMKIDERSTVDFSSLYQEQSFLADITKLGVEYSFDNMAFLRAGYSISPDALDLNDENVYNYGLTLGAGLQYSINNVDVRLDYAFRQVEYFDSNNVFSLIFGF
ncbi:MAG: hypothetical protein DWQ05_05660 [Calditrichaeota bacterium]|nr:MAG: hypothetical protein DWQ05_05660 [Calditrichota bacterium]